MGESKEVTMPRILASKRGLRLLAVTSAIAVATSGAAAYAALSDPGAANRHSSDQTAEVAAQIKYGKAKNVILFLSLIHI